MCRQERLRVEAHWLRSASGSVVVGLVDAGGRLSIAYGTCAECASRQRLYQHVLAWREALEGAGIELSVWRIHRRIGMSLEVIFTEREDGRGSASRPSNAASGPVRVQPQVHREPRLESWTAARL
jgi:hypothetical protein